MPPARRAPRRSPSSPRKAPPPRPRPRSADLTRAASAFTALIETMATLRSPAGCPWDRRQTHRSLRPYLLEETYEALDAIDRGSAADLATELGDVLFQCVFHAQLAAERGRFDIGQIVADVNAKLIRRHPHVFRPDGRPLSAPDRARSLRTPQAVVDQWTRVKAQERASEGLRPRVLGHIPRATPALSRAHAIGARVATVGFDWPAADDVLAKIEEEVGELRAAVHEGRARTIEELGDVLFSLANLSRKLGIHAEEALTRANDKFSARFEQLERRFDRAGLSVHEATPAELESAWALVKQAEATGARATTGRTRSARRSPSRRSR